MAKSERVVYTEEVKPTVEAEVVAEPIVEPVVEVVAPVSLTPDIPGSPTLAGMGSRIKSINESDPRYLEKLTQQLRLRISYFVKKSDGLNEQEQAEFNALRDGVLMTCEKLFSSKQG
jgi:hypothetical protein